MDFAVAALAAASLEDNDRQMVAPCHWLQKADIHQLIRGYSPGEQMSWGQLDLMEEALELDSGFPSIPVMDWHVDNLMAHLVCVINPGSPWTWVLRVVLAPDFIWLGLHPAGTMDAHATALLNVVRHHPAVAGMMLHHRLQFDKEWLVLHSALKQHFGVANDGTIAPAPVSHGIPEADLAVDWMDWCPSPTPAAPEVPTILEPEVEEDPYEQRKRVRAMWR